MTDYPLILQGNTYSFAIHFTGNGGELRYDISNWDLLLHDGTTEGGHRFLNITNADQRYQGRSTELDGLLDFEPQQKGFLARLGPSTYRIRTIEVNADNLTILNPQGYAGDPTFGLNPTIASDHTVTGEWTFTQEIHGDGGFNGDVTGNTIGTHTGDVVGNVTGDVTGSIDTRGANFVVDDGTIHLAALNEDVGEYILGRGIPYGGVILWSGAANAIPTYWFLCDGTNGTPDLRDKFIVGAGGAYAVRSTGGTATPTVDLDIDALATHTHGFTDDGHTLTLDESAPHFHGSGATDRAGPGGGTWNVYGLLPADTAESIAERGHDRGHGQSKTSTEGGGAAHSHSGTTNAGGGVTPTGSVTLDNRPPYFALCYIMKGV